MCDAYRSKMDDSLRGDWASHEANKLQLRTMLCNGSHGSIGDLEDKTEQQHSREKQGGERNINFKSIQGKTPLSTAIVLAVLDFFNIIISFHSSSPQF